MNKIGRPLVDKPNISCPICHKNFYVHPYRIKKTNKICCSKECKYKLIKLNTTVTKKCVICTVNFSFVKSKNKNKNRPNIYCSHACMFKGKITNEITFYREKALQNFPNKCYFCNKIKNLDVHHIDHDRSNNEIKNLMILCRSCHIKYHRLHPTHTT